ncbi:hypothetical protein WR25_15700 [Diploscapter pachys]|uniref:Carboxylesterase type B domain-containing protein n=1 Tax=Diploscapter pachys TaxID=2018661 RepID=A0A2A2J3M0_9BILA|nr:hypothetical protein WR25_15700 [Diploscapter pachys]
MISKSSQELLDAQKKLTHYVEDIWGPYVDGEMIPDQYTTLRSRMKKRNLLIGTVLHETKSTKSIIDERTGRVITNRLHEICHDMAYLHNVTNSLTAEATCVAHYSLDNTSTQIDDDMGYYVETVNYVNANLDPSKKAYVYRQFKLGSPSILGEGLLLEDFKRKGPQLDVSRIIKLKRSTLVVFTVHFERFNLPGLIANFVKTGDPSIENQEKWLPWNREKMNHYLIDFDKSLKMPGNKPDYYRDPYEFWELALPGLSGWSGEAKRFPIGVDCCLISHFVDGLVSHWTNKSAAYSKTLQAEEETYQRFKDLVKFNEAELAELDAKSNILFYVAIPIGILIFVFGLVKFIEYRKRRAYNPL